MIGAKASAASDTIRKYVGFALQAQAGVTAGLTLIIGKTFPTFGDIVLNGLLAAIIISELFAPVLVKFALAKAGEIHRLDEPSA